MHSRVYILSIYCQSIYSPNACTASVNKLQKLGHLPLLLFLGLSALLHGQLKLTSNIDLSKLGLLVRLVSD